MAAKFVFLVACLALAHAGYIKRDAPTTNPLEDIEKHAAEFQKTFSEQLNALVNSKNGQELNNALKDSSDSVLQHLSTLSNSLQAAMGDATGKAKEALEKSSRDIERAGQELRRAHPEVERETNVLKNQIQTAVENALQGTQKLAKDVSANFEQTNQKLTPKIKAAYDDFVKQADAVQKKLHEAATKQ